MSNTELFIVQNADGGYQAVRPDIPGIQAQTANPISDQPPIDSKPRPTRVPIPNELDTGFDHAPWGRDDRLPSRISELIYQVPMAGRAIQKLTQMMFGNGIAYYQNAELANGNKVQRAFVPIVEDFLKINRINTHFLPAQFVNYRLYMNSFCEMVFSRDKTQINRIFHKE
ncbi:MAG: hypothetical protein AAFO07_28755, partial [Bacteroidota bacterium]